MRNLHGGVDGGGDEEEGLVLPAVEQRVQRLVGRHACGQGQWSVVRVRVGVRERVRVQVRVQVRVRARARARVRGRGVDAPIT